MTNYNVIVNFNSNKNYAQKWFAFLRYVYNKI